MAGERTCRENENVNIVPDVSAARSDNQETSSSGPLLLNARPSESYK